VVCLYVTADGGGSNSARSRLWKQELQRLADDTGLSIHVSHLPPGTSKWNKIEHRLFSQITTNWRGKPLVTLEAVVGLIGATTTQTGLKVRAVANTKSYALGRKVTEPDSVFDAAGVLEFVDYGQTAVPIRSQRCGMEADRAVRA